jgi:putative spermidine/putrescine transport system permease protein
LIKGNRSTRAQKSRTSGPRSHERSQLGDPEGSTHVISIAAYDAAYQEYDYAKASAIAMIMAVVMLLVISVVLLGRARLYRGSSGGKG